MSAGNFLNSKKHTFFAVWLALPQTLTARGPVEHIRWGGGFVLYYNKYVWWLWVLVCHKTWTFFLFFLWFLFHKSRHKCNWYLFSCVSYDSYIEKTTAIITDGIAEWWNDKMTKSQNHKNNELIQVGIRFLQVNICISLQATSPNSKKRSLWAHQEFGLKWLASRVEY